MKAVIRDTREATALDRRIGQRARARRLQIGMSQERLAELLGVTFQQVQKYEKGVNRIAASRLYDMATALEMALDEFFDDPIAGATSEAERALATPEGARLMALFSGIKDRTVRRRVVDLVAALVEEAAPKNG